MTRRISIVGAIMVGPRRIAPVVIFLGLLVMASCGSDGDSTGPEAVVPNVSSLSGTTLSPGDTLVVTGSNFAAATADNRVVFNNSLARATPFAAAGGRLDVVVPANANSGGMYVISLGVNSNKVNVTIEREVGDVWVMGGGTSYGFSVPAPNGSEKYLIVAHSATATGQSFPFGVTPSSSSNAPGAAAPQGTGLEPNRVAGTPSIAGGFETRAREEAIEYLREHREAARAAIPKTVVGPVAAPAPMETFLVLNCSDLSNCSTLDPAKFSSVTATLRYTGTHVLLYSDDEQPTGSFTQTDYDELGQQFDDSIYPTDTAYFGSPTDIDGNGRIVVLFSPRVNDLTPDGTAGAGFISGFVLLNDLAPDIFPAGTSNGMEIFYSIVPDPNGEYGNVFPTDGVKGIVPGTLAHEFEHMISNGYRFVTLGGGTDPSYIQQTWLEEGMAHMAEDLNGMDAQNIARANLYLAGPYETSILGNSELRPYDIDTLEQRGGIFLFLRYLGDQIDETIYKKIVQTKKVGIASVENVTTTNFYASVSNFLAALYLSGRGVTSDPRYNYTSLDLVNDFAALAVANRSVGGGTFGGTVRSVAGNFNLVTGGQPPLIQFGVTSGQLSQMRVVIVRTQ